MRKVALVYYSRSGNTRNLAQGACVILNERGFHAEACEIIPSKRVGMISGLLKSMRGVSVSLSNDFKFDPKAYDLVIVMGPVWASNNTPVINGFYNNCCTKGSKYAVVMTAADLTTTANPIKNQESKISSVGAEMVFNKCFKAADLKDEIMFKETVLILVDEVSSSLSKPE